MRFFRVYAFHEVGMRWVVFLLVISKGISFQEMSTLFLLAL
jgi:hypothetical protein